MAKILLLEDDLVLQEIICEYLVGEGYSVDCFANGDDALDSILKSKYNVLLLDVNVPQLDGFELVEYLRGIKNNTPVIFITALSSISSLRKAFDLGANDYLKKPFELAELHLRIEYQLKSISHKVEHKFGEFIFCPADLYLISKGKKIPLRQKEAQILLYFLQQKRTIISLDELIENIWFGEAVPTYATIRTYIKNLRKILGATAIENIKGSGYRLNFM